MKNENVLLVLTILGITIVYLSGLFLPIMENDSALHATMSMQMALSGDFTHIFKVHEPYLDKPHLHFWLAALSMKVFGIHAWAYRTPALCFTLLAAFSVFSLGRLYSDNRSGKWGALIFLTVQAIILSNHDVRTDAVLTGTTIFAIYQFLRFSEKRDWLALILSGVFTSLSLSTKGLYGPFVITCSALSVVVYRRHWHVFHPKNILVLIVAFLIACVPVMYSLYAQFGYEGIAFLFWNQSIERFQSTGFEPFCSDPFFFLHTFLWVFLPWTIIALVGMATSTQSLLRRTTDSYAPELTLLTLGGALFPLFILSFSQYKLPHYMNVAFPMIALLAGHCLTKWQGMGYGKLIIRLRLAQRVLFFIALAFALLLAIFAFPPDSVLRLLVIAVFFGLAVYTLFFIKDKWTSVAYGTLLIGVALNLYLNMEFYRKLIPYQGGDDIAAFIDARDLPKDRVFVLRNDIGWSTYFNSRHIFPMMDQDNINCVDQPLYLIADDTFLNSATASKYHMSKVFETDHYPVSRLTAPFLNRKTRAEKLEKRYVIAVTCPENENR